MMRGASRAWCLVFLTWVSCRTALSPGGRPFVPITAASTEMAWQQLLERRDSFKGARAFARVNAARRSFQTVIEIDRRGNFRIDVLGPGGIGVATLLGDGSALTIIEGSRRETRPLSELSERIGLPAGEWTASELSMILLGLPPAGTERFRFELAPTGIQRVVSGEAEVQYDPPAFPPRKVTVRSGETVFELQFLELVQL